MGRRYRSKTKQLSHENKEKKIQSTLQWKLHRKPCHGGTAVNEGFGFSHGRGGSIPMIMFFPKLSSYIQTDDHARTELHFGLHYMLHSRLAFPKEKQIEPRSLHVALSALFSSILVGADRKHLRKLSLSISVSSAPWNFIAAGPGLRLHSIRFSACSRHLHGTSITDDTKKSSTFSGNQLFACRPPCARHDAAGAPSRQQKLPNSKYNYTTKNASTWAQC